MLAHVHMAVVSISFVGGAVAYLGSAPFAAAEKNYHRRFVTGIRNNMKQHYALSRFKHFQAQPPHQTHSILGLASHAGIWKEFEARRHASSRILSVSLRQCTYHPLSPLLSKKLRQHHIIWVWQGRKQHGSSSCDHGKMWSDMLQYLESVADAGLSSDNRQLRQRVNVTCVSHFFGSFDATGIGLQAARAFCSDCRALKARLGFIFMCVMRLRSSALFAVEWKHARGVPTEVHDEIMADFKIGLQAPCPWLDGKHVVFGHLVEGMEVLDAMEAIGTAFLLWMVGTIRTHWLATTNKKQIWWILWHTIIILFYHIIYIPLTFYPFVWLFTWQIENLMTNQVWNETIWCSASAAKKLTGLWNRRWKDVSLASFKVFGKCSDVMVAWPGKLVCGSWP